MDIHAEQSMIWTESQGGLRSKHIWGLYGELGERGLLSIKAKMVMSESLLCKLFCVAKACEVKKEDKYDGKMLTSNYWSETDDKVRYNRGKQM